MPLIILTCISSADPMRTGTVLVVALLRLAAQPPAVEVRPGFADGKAQVILVRAKGAPDCKESVALPVPASGKVENVRESFESGCGCPSQRIGLAVLAPGRAGTYVDATSLCRLGNGGFDLTVELRPRRVVRIDVWTPSETMRALAKDDIANLDWILDFNMSGMTIDAVFHPPNPLVASSEDFCKVDPPAAVFTPGVINLYFGSGTLNQSCGLGTSVLVHDVPVLGDAAHEVGHRLGLSETDLSTDSFSSGHTTDVPGFTCNNVMWEGSDVLKNLYTLGQAFWMNFSCSSYGASGRPCLRCGDSQEPGEAEPAGCAFFRVGLQAENSPIAKCSACTLDEAGRLLRASGRTDLRIVRTERSQLCDADILRQRLQERFQALSAHVAGNPRLTMGSKSADQFMARWAERIGVILTIESTAKSAPGSKERAAGIQVLRNLSKQPRYQSSRYIPYSIDRIEKGTYHPRCVIDDKRDTTRSRIAEQVSPGQRTGRGSGVARASARIR
jgi:hypothetical protein